MSSSRSATGRAGHGAVREREQLLEAADRVVHRDGSAATMNLIAAEAGITKPILYRHFGDKGGLYRALAARYTEDLLARLRAALATRGGLRGAHPRHDRRLPQRGRASSPQVYRFLMERAAVEEPGVRGEVQGFVRRFGDELASGMRAESALRSTSDARSCGRTGSRAWCRQPATGGWTIPRCRASRWSRS